MLAEDKALGKRDQQMAITLCWEELLKAQGALQWNHDEFRLDVLPLDPGNQLEKTH